MYVYIYIYTNIKVHCLIPTYKRAQLFLGSLPGGVQGGEGESGTWGEVQGPEFPSKDTWRIIVFRIQVMNPTYIWCLYK